MRRGHRVRTHATPVLVASRGRSVLSANTPNLRLVEHLYFTKKALTLVGLLARRREVEANAMDLPRVAAQNGAASG